MLDAGFSLVRSELNLDSLHRMPNGGCWILDSRPKGSPQSSEMLDSGFSMLGEGELIRD